MTGAAIEVVPVAPAIAYQLPNGSWSVWVLQCPYCNLRHTHVDIPGPAATYGRWQSHCGAPCPRGMYEAVQISLPRWADLMDAAPAAVFQALESGLPLSKINRRLRLADGTAESTLERVIAEVA